MPLLIEFGPAEGAGDPLQNLAENARRIGNQYGTNACPSDNYQFGRL